MTMVSVCFPLIFVAHETIYNEPDVVKGTEADSNENEPEPAAIESEPEAVEVDLEDDDDDGPALTPSDLSGEPEDDGKEPADYVEEKTTKDGAHIRKEVHQGDGFKSVRITSDGGSGSAIPSMFEGGKSGGIPDMMGAML